MGHMDQINIEMDSREIEKVLRKVRKIPNGVKTALKRALNKTVTGMKTDALKEVTQNYVVKRKDVADKLKVDRATSAHLGIQLSSRGRPVRSIKFKHKVNRRPGRAGATAAFLQVKKGGSGGLLSGSANRNISKGFVASMPNGTRGIFQRTGKISSRRKEPIKQTYSVGVSEMLSSTTTAEAINNKAIERFNKNLNHSVNYLLESSR